MRLLIIDGSNVFMRGFFGAPRAYASNGTPVWAVHAFLEQLRRYWRDLRPTHWVVAWDTPRAKSWRRDLFPEYKATRKETDPELAAQWPLVLQAVDDLCVPAITRDGYEADDVIASLVAWAATQQLRTTVVSSDKDLVQLLDVMPDLELISPAHGGTVQTREQLLARHGAVGMAFRDAQAIQGDASDNVPGVPGVGKVGARALVADIGLDEFIRRVELGQVFKTSAQRKVAANLPLLLLSRQLVTLSTDVPLPPDLEAFLRARRAPEGAMAKVHSYVPLPGGVARVNTEGT